MEYPFLANFNIKSNSHQMKLLNNRVYLFVWLLSVYFIFSPFVFLLGNIIEFSFEDDAKNYEHSGSKYLYLIASIFIYLLSKMDKIAVQTKGLLNKYALH